MALPRTIDHVTPEEYLAQERLAASRHEYVDGVVVAMGGGSRHRSMLKVDLARLISTQLMNSGCDTYDSDMRVRVDDHRYVYPDLTVVCGASQFADDAFDVLLNPTVVLEVLSPSTELADRGEKWSRYRRMPSLQQYVLVSQEKPAIEVATRVGEAWTFTEAKGLDATIRLEAIGVTLVLAEVYGRVTFDDRDDAVAPGGEPRA